jgi:3-deoxy-D-manno-octulosonic-acid transferase
MISIYRFVSTFLYPILILLIFFRKLINKEDKARYKEKIFPSSFSIIKKKNYDLIWFHAASIGEVQSIFPIIKKLNSNKKNFQFLITTVTLSSGKLVQAEFKDYENIIHRYFPLDVNFLSKKFLALWRPKIVFFVDSEIWPNLILNIADEKIPLAIINGRITSKTFKRWSLIPKTAKKIFNEFTFSLSSNLETKEYLNKLGGKNIFYFGNIKFSNSLDFEKIKNKNKNILENKNFWCAASTHKQEENFCISAHLKLKKVTNNLLTVIIPRHIHRSKHIEKICIKNGLNYQVLNKEDNILENTEIVIINSFGVLQDYFKYAKSVFVGKSVIKNMEQDSGQSPILAAKLGCKIYHGPYVYNFKEVYDILKKHNISKEISNIDELSDHLIEDFKFGKKDFSESKRMIDNLGSKILDETTKKINYFLINEIK